MHYPNTSDDTRLGGYRGGFADNNLSAAKAGTKRPAWEAVERLALSGAVNSIVAYAPDRIHRQPHEMLAFIKRVRDAGNPLKLHFVTSSDADFNSIDGRVMAGIGSILGGAETERMTQRIRDKKKTHAEDGRWNGGRVPIGYMAIPNDEAVTGFGGKLRLVPHPVAGPEVVRVIDDYLSGESLMKCLKRFREVTGEQREYTSFKVSLASPSIAGLRMHLSQEVRGNRRTNELVTTPSLLENEAGFHPGTWEPLISEKKWRAFRDKLINTSDRKRGKRPTLSLLGGMVFCMNCGGPMGYDGIKYKVDGDPESGIHRYPNYRCSDSNHGCGKMRIGAVKLEEFIVDEFVKMLNRVVPDEQLQRINDNAAEIVALETRIQKVTDDLLRAYKDLRDDVITTDVYNAVRATDEATKKRLQDELSDLRLSNVDFENLMSLNEVFNGLSVSKKNARLRIVIDRIAVRKAPPMVGIKNILNPHRLKVVWRVNGGLTETWGSLTSAGTPLLVSRDPLA
ncbi:Recombinase zinc beta ribbon domain-containing protein [Pseudarthrobacter equi]|uniref:Recombinase zinc beta ribbon domain-containing protein n=1 Tax=Pseudarthrobacter equi TaxID=728066 RepID=A0A1H2A9U4_9MICC|nr:Recombinase zinc beta ribbon domain-containing protein [Pseudarthrobacter equi]